MNRLITGIFFLLTIFTSPSLSNVVEASNNCVTFTIGQGTGCDWMCNYCANQLGTNNYYFTDSVCTYQLDEGQVQGGCVGNPISGKQYTCCAVSEYDEL